MPPVIMAASAVTTALFAVAIPGVPLNLMAAAGGAGFLGLSGSTLAGVAITGGLVAANYLLAPTPKVPAYDSSRGVMRQTTPGAWDGVGLDKITGAYALWEERDGRAHEVHMMCLGPIAGFERFFVDDDEIQIDADGWCLASSRFSARDVRLVTRLGLPVLAAFAIPELPPGIWTADHRGDGIAAIYARMESGAAADQPNRWPMRGSTAISAEARLAPLFDPRDPAQSPADRTTWKWAAASGPHPGQNPALQILHLLCHAPSGFGWDYASEIGPEVDSWKAAADVCDLAIPLKAGGSEPQFQAGLSWSAVETEPGETLKALLQACDGHLRMTARGWALTIGVPEPTVTIERENIRSYSWKRFKRTDEAISEIAVTFTSPAHGYTSQEVDPWVIADRGKRAPLSLPACRSYTQARRLGKRAKILAEAEYRLTCFTDMAGWSALGERSVRVRIPEVDMFADCTLILDTAVKIDPGSPTPGAVVEGVVLSPAAYAAWTAASDEGAPPPTATSVTSDAVTANGLTAAAERRGEAVVIVCTWDDPDRPDITWQIQHRLADAGSGEPGAWITTTIVNPTRTGAAPNARLRGETPTVRPGTSFQVRVARVGGSEIWTAPVTISTLEDAVAPASPVILSSAASGADVSVVIRQSGSANAATVTLWRGLSGGTWPDDTQIVAGPTHAGRRVQAILTDTDIPPGTFDYYATSENGSGVRSSAAGPVTVSVS